MGIAAGGNINQVVKRDRGNYQWNATQTKVFNIQILNSLHFKQVTGVSPPKSPISTATYTAHGYPFFNMYEEPTEVTGEFSVVKSIGQIDGTSDPSIVPRLVDGINMSGFSTPVVLWLCSSLCRSWRKPPELKDKLCFSGCGLNRN
jgi:hypothetical protein